KPGRRRPASPRERPQDAGADGAKEPRPVSGPELRLQLRPTVHARSSGPQLRPQLRSTTQAHSSAPQLRLTTQINNSGAELRSRNSGPQHRPTTQAKSQVVTPAHLPRRAGRGIASELDLLPRRCNLFQRWLARLR